MEKVSEPVSGLVWKLALAWVLHNPVGNLVHEVDNTLEHTRNLEWSNI